MSNDLYRSRLSKPLSEKALKYLSSIKEDLEFFEEEIEVQIAHILMLKKIGILNENETKDLIKALYEIKPEEIESSKFEDIHEFIEAKLIEKLGETAMKIQTGRSRNDQVATITRLKVKRELLEIFDELIKFIETLLKKSEQDIQNIIIYRTHRRDAQISILSHYWLAFVDSLMRNLDRIIEAYRRSDLSPLGSSACAGSIIPVDREFTKNILAFNDLIENSLDAVTARDFVLDSLNACVNIMIDLSRMAEDLIFWSGIGIIVLDDTHCSSSSIMPHKKNPDVLEMLKAKTKEVISSYNAVSEILSSLPSGYNRELQRVKSLAIFSLKIVKESISMMNEVVDLLKYEKKIAKEIINKSESFAVDLVEYLVINTNIPFREIHKIIGNILKGEYQRDKIIEEINKMLGVNEQKIREILNPNIILNLRKSKGSPNPTFMNDLIRNRTIKVMEYKKLLINEIEKLKKIKALPIDYLKYIS